MLVEQALLLQCQKGDQSAFRILYNTCAPYVFTIVKNYFSEDHDRCASGNFCPCFYQP
jgi:hypothetical protein